jgi:predicted transcriptional regulator
MLLQKENEAHPLALKKIFTDNVTQSFLKCVSELKEVTELFMLERSAKHKPESFAPRSAVAMDQIRKFVLKRHLPTLKYLMIKNDYQTVWDIDEKAMLLICHQGKNLEELTVSMGIRSVVRGVLRPGERVKENNGKDN